MKRLRRVRPWKWNVRNPGRQRYVKWRVCKQTWHVHMPSTSIFVKLFVLDRKCIWYTYTYMYIQHRSEMCWENQASTSEKRKHLRCSACREAWTNEEWRPNKKSTRDLRNVYHAEPLLRRTKKVPMWILCLFTTSLSCVCSWRTMMDEQEYLRFWKLFDAASWESGACKKIRLKGLMPSTLLTKRPFARSRWSPDHQNEES